MKYKVGDRVKLKKLEPDTTYGEVFKKEFNPDDCEILSNKIVTIAEIDDDLSYQVDGVEYGQWIPEECFLRKVPKTTRSAELEAMEIANTLKESSEDVLKAIGELANSVKQRTISDAVLEQALIERIKETKLEDISKDITEKTCKKLEEIYGVIPKKLEIVNGDVKKEMTGLFHHKFEEIVNIISKGVPLMLTGPAGAGKNHTLEQVAEALGLEFYFTNAVTQEYKLTGFIDANGVYQETQFYKAFKDGGLFFLDEVDASVPEALIIMNSAIANGYFDFPNGRINCHQDFRVVCAGNTYGTGADMIYVGRNALDGATLDRFTVVEFDYDEEIEKQLAYDDTLFSFIKSLRNAIQEASLRYIVSMRATINATKLLEIGLPKEEILKTTIIKNMQIDDLNVIVRKISVRNEWTRKLEELIRARG